ncbi:hypothetical protein FSU_0919 [Fibrobacter succinogenes subsp. succinogenes S85]|uniref:Uncharacterized protein n=1 Tax=Fibrobacter succinogenes (strain ATCC 19169 / S85) TaxID=59374 RepID=D9S8S4_FIBSS|nr:hypothetical protein FSU_0919 [Fibrobacter succinogenes subsp. succinogenes S85]
MGNDMKEVLRNNAKQACYAPSSARSTKKFLHFPSVTFSTGIAIPMD